MIEHPTFEPTDTVRLHHGTPSGAADTTAAFADLVCSDHELVRAEFDAIITANFPDPADGTQRDHPPRTVATRTPRAAPRGAAAPSSHRPERGSVAGGQHPQARQRGPPVVRHDTPAGRQPPFPQGRGGDRSTDRRWTRGHSAHADSDRHGKRGKSTCHP